MTRRIRTKKQSIVDWHGSGSDRNNPENLQLETGHVK